MTTFKQKMKKIIAGALLVGTLYTAKPAMAQASKEEEKSQPKIVEVQKAPMPGAAFSLIPAYSVPGQYSIVRIAGGGKVYGIGIGGFLDITGTKEAPADMKSHLGKVTASKSLDSIVKGAGVAVELTTISGAKDQVRAGAYKTGKLLGVNYKVQIYPVAPKGKGPSAGIFLSKKISPKVGASAFLTSDLGAKSYYGEAQLTYDILEKVSLILQERYGGIFGRDFTPQTHLGIELKL